MTLTAPFPYFGGKRRAAAEIWRRFGSPRNYVEPFAGSCAVLLGRPHPSPKNIETVNDADGLLANVWRAMAWRPDEVIQHADWPVNEADLHARHLWLIGQREAITDQLIADPEWCDPRAAGWWIWGACAWIGRDWCSGNGPWVLHDGALVRRDEVGDAGRGINRQLPNIGGGKNTPYYGNGINRQIPHLSGSKSTPRYGAGVHALTAPSVAAHLCPIAERMRRVRVACGDWSRVITPSVTYAHGLTGVLLDPPYDGGNVDYAAGGRGVAADVRAWCLDNGENPLLRIALCGYEGDHDEIESHGWQAWEWKANGGYGSQAAGDGRENAARERVWFSPHCLRTGEQVGLF